MKLLDTIREQLDSVEATNASKIYTPFTLFCIFFAIYFNADILGSIFLSTKWETKSAALKLLANRDWEAWFWFSLRVISYSLGMMILYGLAQAGAAFVWGISNWANTTFSAYSNKSNYVAKSEFDKVLIEANTLRKNEKELYVIIGSYHEWEPEDLTRLQSDNKRISTQLLESNKKNDEQEKSIDVLTSERDFELRNYNDEKKERAKSDGRNLGYRRSSDFFRGFSDILLDVDKWSESGKINENELINSTIELAIDKHQIYIELEKINTMPKQKGLRGLNVASGSIANRDFSFKYGIAIGLLKSLKLISVVITEHDSQPEESYVSITLHSRFQLA